MAVAMVEKDVCARPVPSFTRSEEEMREWLAWKTLVEQCKNCRALCPTRYEVEKKEEEDFD